ncbi:MAG: PP2C family protein-serine/threonine phosphatase [Lysinibacillus sp.]|nr:PP2C family protein-serine/threonine phosphatase [Lysinibacillus sp.]
MKELKVQYEKVLLQYLLNQNESNLYIGQNLVRQLMKNNVSPEDLVSIHKQSLENILPDLPETVSISFDFLIEVMIHFGLKIKEHQSLIMRQEEMRIEMEIASKIQNLLLETKIPKPSGLDIGMVSVPVRKMNGDYVHFMHDDGNFFSVAVTDVVGKGVPAALCMSMVKYGLDTLEYANNNPSYVLEVLNRIIEKSVDDSMFVSMFYGRYDLENDIFTFGSAGHEPAFFFNSAEQTFIDLDSKGLLLGVLPEMKYSQNDIHLSENDFIILITDGVTEFKKMANFNSRSYIKELAKSIRHLSAQEMCNKIFEDLNNLQDFSLEDDFTVVIIKKY